MAASDEDLELNSKNLYNDLLGRIGVKPAPQPPVPKLEPELQKNPPAQTVGAEPEIKQNPEPKPRPQPAWEDVREPVQATVEKQMPGSGWYWILIFLTVVGVTVFVQVGNYMGNRAKPQTTVQDNATEVIPGYTSVELVAGPVCENNLLTEDSQITGRANNVSILGMQTGPKTEFAVWEVGGNEMCTNSDNMRSLVYSPKVTNEGDNNCIGFFERLGRNPPKRFNLKVIGGGLHVCTEPFKG